MSLIEQTYFGCIIHFQVTFKEQASVGESGGDKDEWIEEIKGY